MYLEENLKSEAINESHSQSYIEKRKEYQKRYYQEHKEHAKAYQRQYKLTYIRKQKPKKSAGSSPSSREPYKSAYTASDIIYSPIEKTLKMLEKIIRGERFYT